MKINCVYIEWAFWIVGETLSHRKFVEFQFLIRILGTKVANFKFLLNISLKFFLIFLRNCLKNLLSLWKNHENSNLSVTFSSKTLLPLLCSVKLFHLHQTKKWRPWDFSLKYRLHKSRKRVLKWRETNVIMMTLWWPKDDAKLRIN